jgi:hypothetical protein
VSYTNPKSVLGGKEQWNRSNGTVAMVLERSSLLALPHSNIQLLQTLLPPLLNDSDKI